MSESSSEAASEEISRLVDRFVEDADDLSESEWAALANAARSDHALVERLRDQLRVDELLRQRFSPDRGDFPAQVGQRLLDHQRGESELDLRTAELRRLAIGQLSAPAATGARRRAPIIVWASLASVLLALAAAALAGYFGRGVEVAHVRDISGEVILVRNGERFPAEPAMPLSSGDALEIASGGAVTISYDDATSVEVMGGSRLTIEAAKGKQLMLGAGELTASIAPQPEGRPMIFRTPTARAVVVGTKLRLRAGDEETELEVVEGAVEFALGNEEDDGEVGEAEPQVISAQQTAVANRQGLAVRSATWPLYREGLIVLAPTGVGEGLRRDAKENQLTPFRFSASGAARFDGALAIHFAGGVFVSRQAGADVVELCRRSKSLTLEAIFESAEWQDDSESLLIAVESEGKSILELSRVGEWLNWKVLAGDQMRESRLSQLLEGERTHLVVAIGDGGTAAFVNGQSVFDDASHTGDFQAWTTGLLRLGGGERGSRPFHGQLLGAAIYDRAFTRGEAKASSRRLPVDAAIP